MNTNILSNQPEILIIAKEPDDILKIGLRADESFRIGLKVGLLPVVPSDSGSATVSDSMSETVRASETLVTRTAVTSDGFHVNPSDTASLSRYAGVTTGSVLTGEDVVIKKYGSVEENLWTWEVNKPIWIGEEGVLTQTTPVGYPYRRIGWAISATKILLDPYPVIEGN